ncbi:hypothetical protein [Labrys sp. 22185]|uniref:hypothetical protein n=1 Tax=Labrys sp. 22185 TaxID=3453888 RepID=UPI003F85DD7D
MSMSEDNATDRAKTNKYHRQWVKQVLGDKVQTYAHIDPAVHARVQKLAERQQKRIPQVIGSLVLIGLEVLEMMEPPAALAPPAPPSRVDMTALTPLVLASRFPKDSEATRYRMLGTLNLIYMESLKGSAPTGNQLARLAETSTTHMNLTTRVLEQRGLIERTSTNSGVGGKRSLTLRIREDAAQAFNEAHMIATGEPINPGAQPPTPVKKRSRSKKDASSGEEP